jgi:adenylylsulfate kinase
VTRDSGFVLWFTGLSGAGKSTLARRVEQELAERGLRVEVLDGDEVRLNLCEGLGFSRADRDTNVARIGWVAGKLAHHGVAVLVAAISPYAEARERVRASVDDFVEVFVDAPLATCAERDPKGLYARAMAGDIPNFTGVSDPYEPPLRGRGGDRPPDGGGERGDDPRRHGGAGLRRGRRRQRPEAAVIVSEIDARSTRPS